MCETASKRSASNLHCYTDDRVQVYDAFFDSDTGGKIFAEHGTFDIIHAHNVITHCPAPISMLKGMMKLMHDKSVLILEFKYLVDMLKQTQFYHIHHGHYFYFSVNGPRELMLTNSKTRHLKMLTAERVDAQGGSILCALSKDTERMNDGILKSYFESEREYLNQPDIFEKFVSETDRQLKVFVDYVNSHNSESVQGLFANAKAVVLLNLALQHGLQLDRFNSFHDNTPELQGHRVPGTNISIRPLRQMENRDDRTVILFAPNLLDLATAMLPNAKIVSIVNVLKD